MRPNYTNLMFLQSNMTVMGSMNGRPGLMFAFLVFHWYYDINVATK